MDLGRELGLLDLEPWTRLLDESRWVRQVVGDTAIPETCLARPASSHMLRPVHGEGWLAVGDAASAFDPLSAQGIVKALRSGVVASYAAADFLLKQEGVGLQRYEALHQREVLGYARAHARYFAQEQRWPEHRFWRRRHGGMEHGVNAALHPSG
ncbi:NAD(P)/FAD-dependent oxidoreductase [Archangium sp.]|uniref:NAD(P)/FAD-dependent oxidoreductase n=1 Tax=Archangium sp. TaxID=1872627 RepID=UPI00389B0342